VTSHQPESGNDGVPAQPAPDQVTTDGEPQPAPDGAAPAPDDAAPAPDHAGPAPDRVAPAPVAGRRGRVVGIVLAAVLGGLAVLCVGGLGTGYLLYRKASEPDRSTPGVVVRQYLQATFDDRDESKAARFTCTRPADIGEMQQELADIVSREKRFGIRITVGWENFTVEESKATATVGARLKIAVPEENGQPSESFQQWSFAMRHQNSGWRVCDAHRIS
jgi:hypothetical protein